MVSDQLLNTKGNIKSYMGSGKYFSGPYLNNVTYRDLVAIGIFKIENIDGKQYLSSNYPNIESFIASRNAE
jgi:hypothetical protein